MLDLSGLTDAELQARAAATLAGLKDAARLWCRQRDYAVQAREVADKALALANAYGREYRRLQDERQAILVEDARRRTFVVIDTGENRSCST